MGRLLIIRLILFVLFTGQVKSIVPPAQERKKLVPLALMFFCILFNYTILRDTKDVLMVTAPKSGAEVIPFIKTYVNLPAAIVSRKMFMGCLPCYFRCSHFMLLYSWYDRVSLVFTHP